MHEATTSREQVEETTLSSMVPGAHIEVAFQKLGKDVAQFVKGSGAYPHGIGNERGYYHVDAMPVLPESLPEMLERLYDLQDSGTEEAVEIASALIENLTTKNDITNEELAWLFHIAEGGGKFEISRVVEATPGMSKALGKVKWKGNCEGCDFQIPKYAGRYPKACPGCGQELRLSKQGYSSTGKDSAYKAEEVINADPQAQLALGTHRESFELAEASPLVKMAEVEDALVILEKRVRLVKGAGLNESVVAGTYPLPLEATNLQKALLGEAEESPHEIFDALVTYLSESFDPRFDKLVGVLFEKHSLEEGLTARIRGEVERRKPLRKSIASLVDMADLDRKYFTLNKALSSCFTRVMIEGETMGGKNFKFIGKRIFEMMQKALDGDLDGPTRFLNTYFLEG